MRLLKALEQADLADIGRAMHRFAAELYPIRDTYLTTATGERQASEATWVAPNPPIGAVFTYSVGQPWPADTKLVLNISDDSGRQVRRIDLTTQPGVRRAG